MAQVTVVGSYVQDHCWVTDRFPAVGETRVGQFLTGPGGKGFNQAIASLRQGASTRFIGALGDDALAATARAFAADEGLDCIWQAVDGRPTATASIVVDRNGHNLIVVDLGANLALDGAAASQAIDTDAKVVLCQLETNLEATAAALTRAREIGAIALLNPAPLHPQLSPELLALADIITPNETEFSLLLGMLGVPDDARTPWDMDDTDLHALCRCSAVATVVLTLGEHGCFVSHSRDHRGDDAAYYRLPAESVHAIDSSGAGDAYSGALAAALALQITPFRRAVVHANRVAALSTEKRGTAPAMPTRAQVGERFLDR